MAKKKELKPEPDCGGIKMMTMAEMKKLTEKKKTQEKKKK